jgi:hypothetical protein
MILAKSDPLLARTGRPPRADGRYFFMRREQAPVVDPGAWKEFADDFAPFR